MLSLSTILENRSHIRCVDVTASYYRLVKHDSSSFQLLKNTAVYQVLQVS